MRVGLVIDQSDPPRGGAEIIEWETIDCPLCRHSRSSPLLEAEDPRQVVPGLAFSVVRCEECGLAFTNPRPSPASIGRFYASDYGPHQGCGLSPSQRRRAGWRRRMPQWWRARHPAGRGLPWHGQGRLLDFGCGNGAFLELMHLQGWHVTGVDASEETVLRIVKELHLPALAGSLPHGDLSPGQFDVVTMWHSLEHVHQPLEILKQAYDLLVPGGRLFVAVPNLDSGPFRWFGAAWFCLELPRHLTHFTPQTLRRMVEAASFQVEGVQMLRNSDWLRRSAELAVRRHVPGPTWLRSRRLSRLAASYLCWTKQSDSLLLTAVKPHAGRQP